MRRIIALITVAAMLVFVASPAQASHEPIGLHRHLLNPPGTTEVELARGICKNELVNPALHNVHVHFHEGQPTEAFETNPVDERATACA